MKEQILALVEAYADAVSEERHGISFGNPVPVRQARAALVAALDALMTERDWLAEQNQKLTRIHAERTVERDALRKAASEQSEPVKKRSPVGMASYGMVGEYNRGWNDCLFASGVERPAPQPTELTDTDILHCLKEVDPHTQRLPLGMKLFARAVLAAANK